MGITRVTVTVSNLEKSKKGYEAEFMVDTGAIDCMASASNRKRSSWGNTQIG